MYRGKKHTCDQCRDCDHVVALFTHKKADPLHDYQCDCDVRGLLALEGNHCHVYASELAERLDEEKMHAFHARQRLDVHEDVCACVW